MEIPGANLGDEVALDVEALSVCEDIGAGERRDVDAWLRWLAARASTLPERLDISYMTSDGPADERLARARLGYWTDRVTLDDKEGAFERYLTFAGMGEPAARRAVGPVKLREGSPLPPWANTLGEALTAPCYDPVPGVCDPEHPIPFETLLLPFVHIYMRRVAAAASAGHGQMTAEARHGLARNLLTTLSMMARDALYAEFCRYRLADLAPLAPFVFPEPDPLYRRFVNQMRADGWFALYEVYPVLARRLATQTDLFAATVGEFLRRLAADLPAICRLWERGDPGPVTEVRAGLSDPHRGGRQVFGVTFASGLRLVYKPKDLGIAVAYNAFLAWLKAAGAPVTLRPLQVLNCQTHGWVEYIEPAPCADRAAVARYYQRAGALACLVCLLQGSDCHSDNLIAAGEDPVLVDCETLLSPWPCAADGPVDGDRQRARLNRLTRESVLSTGLLPSLGHEYEDERSFSTPGLCRHIFSNSRKYRNRWTHINTDRMAVGQTPIGAAVEDHLPQLDGLPADVGEYVEPLVAGFSATYRFLMAQQAALLAADGPLDDFRDCFVRFVLRATHLYVVLSGAALGLTALTDGVAYSLYFEPLALAFLLSDPSPAGRAIFAAERGALLQGDVPFFGGRTDQTALLLENGERIEDYFVGPSYDAAQARLRNLSEQDLDFQVGLIRAAIGVYGVLQERAALSDLHRKA